MKRWTDDMADWRLRQENLARPFPYVYPQMPPRLRRCCAFTRTLLLLEWGCLILMALSGAALCGVLLVRGEGAFSACWDGSALFALGTAAFVLSIPLGAVCRALRHTPKFFWRCPCCGLPFSYYAPPFLGMDVLRAADCVYAMKDRRIRYVKPKFCPLVVPSLCPECGAKFFRVPEDFPAGKE